MPSSETGVKIYTFPSNIPNWFNLFSHSHCHKYVIIHKKILAHFFHIHNKLTTHKFIWNSWKKKQIRNAFARKNKLTATRFAEIQTNQLHHVWFQKINIPPWNSLCFGKWACILCIKCWCWAVDGFLWNSSAFGANLHGSLMKVTQKQNNLEIWINFRWVFHRLILTLPAATFNTEMKFQTRKKINR